jgi:hypothetical protein
MEIVMPQTQQAASMPKEWYDQLHELAYGQPADQRPSDSDASRSEKSDAVKWTASATLMRFMPAFRI